MPRPERWLALAVHIEWPNDRGVKGGLSLWLPQGVSPMTSFCRTIFVLVAFVCVASPAFAEDKPHVPTIDDLLNIDSVGGVRISPNGKWVAYSAGWHALQGRDE